MKHAEIDVERQSPQVQAAIALLRGMLPPDVVARGCELAGVLDQLQADDELLLAGLLVPGFPALADQAERLAAEGL